MHHICMIVPDPLVHGGIAAVTSGYYGSRLESDCRVTYVQSYCDGSKKDKLKKALKAYRQFREILKKDPPELVHIHSSFGPSFYRKLPFIEMAAKRHIPVVNHIHGSAFAEFYENAPEWKKKLVRKTYGKCSRMIVLTEHWKKVLAGTFPEENIRVIPNYSVLHPEVMTGEGRDLRRKKQQILYLGVLTEGKGMREMPDIIRKTAESFPEVTFVLAGVGDRSLVTENLPWNVLKKNVRFPGWIRGEEKETLLRESMAFLLPSHMEAMPMSLLEAMGYGLPMVSTNVGGIPNLAGDGPQAVLANVGDSKAMAEALIRLLSGRELWEEASEASFQRAEKNYGFEQHLDRIEAVYREVLEENG